MPRAITTPPSQIQATSGLTQARKVPVPVVGSRGFTTT